MTARLADNVLVSAPDHSDEVFMRQAYDLFYRPLCYFAKRLTAEDQEAEDIVVDCFLKVLDKSKHFDEPSDTKSFLFTAVRNACFDHLRHVKIKNKYVREQVYSSNSSEEFGNEEMIRSKVLQIIYAEIEALPQQSKNVFKAFFIDGKSTCDIAAKFGVNKQTVLNQKSTALRTLRTKLHEQGLFAVALFIASYCLP